MGVAPSRGDPARRLRPASARTGGQPAGGVPHTDIDRGIAATKHRAGSFSFSQFTGEKVRDNGVPGPQRYTVGKGIAATKHHAGSFSFTQHTRGEAKASDAPGPGAYFKAPPGEAVSGMTRYGNHTMARQAKKWADAVGRPPSSPRMVDMAHRY
jgi:hypothetical protein